MLRNKFVVIGLTSFVLTSIVSSRSLLAAKFATRDDGKSIWEQMSEGDRNLYSKIYDEVKRAVDAEFADENLFKDLVLGPNGEVLSINGVIPGLEGGDYDLTFSPSSPQLISAAIRNFTSTTSKTSSTQSGPLVVKTLASTNVGGETFSGTTPNTVPSQPVEQTSQVTTPEPEPQVAPYIPPSLPAPSVKPKPRVVVAKASTKTAVPSSTPAPKKEEVKQPEVKQEQKREEQQVRKEEHQQSYTDKPHKEGKNKG
jgi:hypothetical protein